jgi:hypothetical protein
MSSPSIYALYSELVHRLIFLLSTLVPSYGEFNRLKYFIFILYRKYSRFVLPYSHFPFSELPFM